MTGKQELTDKDVQAIADATGGTVEGAPALADGTVRQWEPLLAKVPDAAGGGYESILGQLAEATDLAGLNAPWTAGGLEDYQDRQLVVRGLRKMPSDFDGGLPYFLILDAVEKVSGEAVQITTGSVGIVGQLVQAFALDLFPVTVVPRKAARKTRGGFDVWHLEFIA